MSASFRLFASSALLVGMSQAALAQGFAPSFGLHGSIGLIDMPTAAMQPDGETSWSLINNGVSTGGVLDFQLLPNVEVSARIVNLSDWSAPGVSFSDNTLDLKFGLVQEGNVMPAIAIGFTSEAFPVAWLGSITIGRWVSSRSIGTADRSNVFLV